MGNSTHCLLSLDLDLASGSSVDWVYGTRNVPLAYTFELRDKGKRIVNICD